MSTESLDLEALSDGLLRRRKELVAYQIDALSEFPHYREVPQEELRVSCDRNVIRAASILRGEDSLPPEVVENERRSGARRAEQGIPAEVVLAAYRRVIGIIRDAYLAEATAGGVHLEATLLGMRRLWELTDHFSSALVSSRHEVDLDLARRNEQHRLDFVRAVLDGTSTDADNARYGVLDTEDYWIVRGRQRKESAQGFVHAVERAGRKASFAPLIIPIGRDIAGVLGQRPSRLELGEGLLAAEGPVRPSHFPVACEQVSRTLAAAWRFDMSGVVDRHRLGLRVTVAEQVGVSELCYEKYVLPVLNGSAMGAEILDSIRVLLETSRSIRDTARRQSIHVNTLRYRLEKFEEITRCELRDTDTLVEIWWALNYAAIAH